MPVIRRSTKAGHRAPSMITGINWASPWAQGIIAAYPFMSSHQDATGRHHGEPAGSFAPFVGNALGGVSLGTQQDNQEIVLPNESAFEGHDEFSCAFDVIFNGFSATNYPVITSKGANDVFYIIGVAASSSGPIQFSVNGSAVNSNLSAATVGTPYRVLCTWGNVAGGFRQRIWINGELATSVARSGALSTNTDPVWVGDRSTDSSRPFNGQLRNLRYWARCFNSEEAVRLDRNPYDIYQTNPRTYDLGTPAAAATSSPTVIRKTQKAGPKAPNPAIARTRPQHCTNQYTFVGGVLRADFGSAPLTLSGTAAPTATRGGVGAKLAGNSGYYSGEGNETVTGAIEVLFVPAVASTAAALVTMAESPGSGTRDRSVYLDATGVVRGYVFDTAQRHVISTTPYVVGEVMHAMILYSNPNDLRLYINGVLEDTDGLASAPYTGYSTPELVIGWGGGSQGGAQDLDSTAVILLARVYDSDELSEGFIRSVAADPWQYHTNPRTISLPGAAAAAATGTGQTVFRRSL